MFLAIKDIKPTMQHLRIPHKGIVVDNVDPLKLQRVKCTITDLIDETDYDKLPWISKLESSFLGGSLNSGTFSVPEIGSEVQIVFPYNDIYFGFYDGVWSSSKTSLTEFHTDYPNTYGWKDGTGNIFIVNKITGDVQFTTSSGTYVLVTSAGKVTIQKGAENLTDLIHQLCTACENITTLTGIGVQPAINKPTFTVLKAKIGDFV